MEMKSGRDADGWMLAGSGLATPEAWVQCLQVGGCVGVWSLVRAGAGCPLHCLLVRSSATGIG